MSHVFWCVQPAPSNYKTLSRQKTLPMNRMKWKCCQCKPPKKTSTPKTCDLDPSGAPPPSIVNIDTNALIAYIDSKFQALKEERNNEIQNLKAYLDDKLNDVTNKVMLRSSKKKRVGIEVIRHTFLRS